MYVRHILVSISSVNILMENGLKISVIRDTSKILRSVTIGRMSTCDVHVHKDQISSTNHSNSIAVC